MRQYEYSKLCWSLRKNWSHVTPALGHSFSLGPQSHYDHWWPLYDYFATKWCQSCDQRQEKGAKNNGQQLVADRSQEQKMVNDFTITLVTKVVLGTASATSLWPKRTCGVCRLVADWSPTNHRPLYDCPFLTVAKCSSSGRKCSVTRV